MCASALTRSIGRGGLEAWPHEERAPLIHWMADLRRENIFERAFKIYGIWPQASKQARIHTHFRNAVPLVWGSLRLAPIRI